MSVLTTADAVTLSTALLVWWECHGRGEIPWKLLPSGVSPASGQDLNPYGIWIAEVMLQQTQLAVALPYWVRWMAAFPTVEALAAASLDEVRLQWQGLGYYSRARRLHEAARRLVGRSWPRTLEGWMALPLQPHLIQGRRGQALDRGKRLHPTRPVGESHGQLGLLQHHLGDPDAVGIEILLRRWTCAARQLLPGDAAAAMPLPPSQ